MLLRHRCIWQKCEWAVHLKEETASVNRVVLRFFFLLFTGCQHARGKRKCYAYPVFFFFFCIIIRGFLIIHLLAKILIWTCQPGLSCSSLWAITSLVKRDNSSDYHFGDRQRHQFLMVSLDKIHYTVLH